MFSVRLGTYSLCHGYDYNMSIHSANGNRQRKTINLHKSHLLVMNACSLFFLPGKSFQYSNTLIHKKLRGRNHEQLCRRILNC
jgi:Fe-S cluster assembly iron-binding protein IscA